MLAASGDGVQVLWCHPGEVGRVLGYLLAPDKICNRDRESAVTHPEVGVHETLQIAGSCQFVDPSAGAVLIEGMPTQSRGGSRGPQIAVSEPSQTAGLATATTSYGTDTKSGALWALARGGGTVSLRLVVEQTCLVSEDRGLSAVGEVEFGEQP